MPPARASPSPGPGPGMAGPEAGGSVAAGSWWGRDADLRAAALPKGPALPVPHPSPAASPGTPLTSFTANLYFFSSDVMLAGAGGAAVWLPAAVSLPAAVWSPAAVWLPAAVSLPAVWSPAEVWSPAAVWLPPAVWLLSKMSRMTGLSLSCSSMRTRGIWCQSLRSSGGEAFSLLFPGAGCRILSSAASMSLSSSFNRCFTSEYLQDKRQLPGSVKVMGMCSSSSPLHWLGPSWGPQLSA